MRKGKMIHNSSNIRDGVNPICINGGKKKMTKYYTMSECFEACQDNDIPFIEGGFNHGLKLTKSKLINEDLSPSIKEHLTDKWQIKRAEPEILSVSKILHDTIGDNHITLPEVIKYGEHCDKNGQLTEWLRPEQVELRRIIESYLNNVPYPEPEIKKAFEKLKPPYQQ
jgi:hypothetical protein